jgi:hypothetical protein
VPVDHPAWLPRILGLPSAGTNAYIRPASASPLVTVATVTLAPGLISLGGSGSYRAGDRSAPARRSTMLDLLLNVIEVR